MTNKEAAAILKTEDCDDCTFRGYSSCKLIKCSVKQAHCVAIEVLDNESSQGEWIPVSEGLPNRNGVYNVTRKLKEGETIYFISDASYFDGQNTWHRDTGINHGRPYLTDVIAWMPRPEPYKDGGAE